ncbi:MAG TPA: Smr/MutS family protein [Polyangiales bacterium]|nr:Smr/MutS family protein [Polyangiales bacterium]
MADTSKPAGAPRGKAQSAEARGVEAAARKRVAGLVAGGLHFKVKREPGRILGQRGAGSSKLAARVAGKGFAPEVTLDLREKPATETSDTISSFLSAQHRRGVKQMSIVFGASPAGDEANAPLEAVVKALTLGASAALVRAFSTAHESRGGNTALAVLLI